LVEYNQLLIGLNNDAKVLCYYSFLDINRKCRMLEQGNSASLGSHVMLSSNTKGQPSIASSSVILLTRVVVGFFCFFIYFFFAIACASLQT